MISKYGTDTAVRSLLALLIVAGCLVLFLHATLAREIVVVVAAVLGFLILNFFRDPERVVPQEHGIVVAPADGKVVLIRDLFEPDYLKQEAVQVSIFMSPLNVHVNRFPISGKIGYFQYIPGEYLVAFHEKSSERNERTVIGVETNGYRIMFRQIAGALARRIVAPLKVGQLAVCGERFGMIKFGSRVDVIMPRHSVLRIRMHDHVVAGETILASYSEIVTPAGPEKR